MADETIQEQAAVDEGPVATPAELKMAAFRNKLINARGRIVGGKRSNMLDQIADGCCDAIDAILSAMTPGS